MVASFVDPCESSSFDSTDISSRTGAVCTDPLTQVSSALKRRKVAFVCSEEARSIRRDASSEQPVHCKLEAGDVGSCVHFLLRDEGGEHMHVTLHCEIEPITYRTYDVHIELFSSPTTLRHMKTLTHLYHCDRDATLQWLKHHKLSDVLRSPPEISTSAKGDDDCVPTPIEEPTASAHHPAQSSERQ